MLEYLSGEATAALPKVTSGLLKEATVIPMICGLYLDGLLVSRDWVLAGKYVSVLKLDEMSNHSQT